MRVIFLLRTTLVDQVSCVFEGSEPCFQVSDALADAAPVRLQLRLARPARADAAAEAGKRRALALQARIHVLQHGELYLQFAFVRLGVFGKDVEDERRPVDDLFIAERLRNIQRLRRGQVAVVQHGHVQALQAGGKFRQLPGPDHRGGVDLAYLLADGACMSGARTLDQRDGLFLPNGVGVVKDRLDDIYPFLLFDFASFLHIFTVCEVLCHA